MKKFIKSNKCISVFFTISITIVFAYILSIDKTEWFPHAGDWFNVLFQLAIGFIINFIFYITQIYIPQQKEQKQAYKCIELRIKDIVDYMTEIFNYLALNYVKDYTSVDNLNEEQMFTMLINLNIDDEIKMINSSRVGMKNQHFTVNEFIISRVQFIESSIDKLYIYYSQYISADLMDVLEKILKSTVHKNLLRSLLQISAEIPFKECKEDIFFMPYYKLMKKLNHIKNNYKIT